MREAMMPPSSPVTSRMSAMRTISAAAVAALVVFGCVTIDEMAPPITPSMQTIAEREGYSVRQLEHGRQLYLTDCVKCHSPEPVTRYTLAEWHEIMPRMARDSNFSPEQEAAVTAYVRFILLTPDAVPTR